jgi:hypothetical protein
MLVDNRRVTGAGPAIPDGLLPSRYITSSGMRRRAGEPPAQRPDRRPIAAELKARKKCLLQKLQGRKRNLVRGRDLSRADTKGQIGWKIISVAHWLA